MKTKIIDTIIILICIITLIELFINKLLVYNSISYSLNIWINSLLPSLLPIFILSDILINYNITNYIPKKIKNIITKLFNVSDNIVTLFFLSLISGFPSSAKNIKQMEDNKLITKKEAEHALIFTHFSNPLFILGPISTHFLKDKKLGLIILLSHYIPNIILAIITRKNNIPTNKIKKEKEIISFPKVMINAINNSLSTILFIFGTLSSFLVLSSLIINRLNLNPYNSTIIKCLLEITMGLKSLSKLNINNLYKVIISSMTLSFGGFAIHMQVLSFIEENNISYKKFFISRIYHSLLSGILAYIFYKLLY